MSILDNYICACLLFIVQPALLKYFLYFARFYLFSYSSNIFYAMIFVKFYLVCYDVNIFNVFAFKEYLAIIELVSKQLRGRDLIFNIITILIIYIKYIVSNNFRIFTNSHKLK